MKRAALVAMIVWTVLGAQRALADPARAASELTLDQVIARHIEARGGAERWQAIRSLEMSGNMKYLSEASRFTLRLARGDRYLLESTSGEVTRALAYDGRVAWRGSRADPGAAQRVSGVDLAMVVRDADFPTPFFDYRERGYEVRLLGPTDFDGSEALGVEVKRGDGFGETWYLDPVSCLDMGRDSPGSHHGDPVPMRTSFDDFRTVAGVRLPHRIESQWHSEERVLEVMKVDLNVEVDDTRFSLPRPMGMEPLLALAGEWTVVASQSAHPGAPWRDSERASTIENLLAGALLEERYTTASGQQVVRSYSYDRFRSRYRLTEISDASNYLDIQEGTFDDQGKLVLSNLDTRTPMMVGGHIVNVRTTIAEITGAGFRIDKEISTDEGGTWTPVAKATYRRLTTQPR